MEDLIVLVNFNEYLGGGETLLVRFSAFLHKENIAFAVLCKEKSFISNELIKNSTPPNFLIEINSDTNLLYLSYNNQLKLIETLNGKLPKNYRLRFVTFSMKEIYIANELTKQNSNNSITHLILHIEDDLYLSQTILDKLIYKLLNVRLFNNSKIIKSNRFLIEKIQHSNGLICMSELISKVWNERLSVKLQSNQIVPLPTIAKKDIPKEFVLNSINNTILWIGRVVDFKIPAIISMIDFISKSNYYKFVIVGDGDLKFLREYIRKNNIDYQKIEILGQIEYSELKNIISNCWIGYAMGTSLVELAKYNIPVIVALASYSHEKFNNSICGGIFYDKYKGCDGSELAHSDYLSYVITIDDAINRIQDDYVNISKKCFEYAISNYSIEKNFNEYLNIIKNTKSISNDEFSLPKLSCIRKTIYNLY